MNAKLCEPKRHMKKEFVILSAAVLQAERTISLATTPGSLQ
jgi:hypothetical protein